MEYNFFVSIIEKKIENAIVEELYKKKIIDFFNANSIISKLDEEINKLKPDDNMKNIVVKIPL